MATINAATSEDYAKVPPDGSARVDGFLFTGTAIATADKLRLCKLGAGCSIPDLMLSTDAANAGATVSVGWEYVDGSASAPAEYVSAASIASAGVVRSNTTGARTVLAKDAYLIVTPAGASISSGTNLRVRPTLQFVGL